MTLQKALWYAVVALTAHQRNLVKDPSLDERSKCQAVAEYTEAVAKIETMRLLVGNQDD